MDILIKVLNAEYIKGIGNTLYSIFYMDPMEDIGSSQLILADSEDEATQIFWEEFDGEEGEPQIIEIGKITPFTSIK